MNPSTRPTEVVSPTPVQPIDSIPPTATANNAGGDSSTASVAENATATQRRRGRKSPFTPQQMQVIESFHEEYRQLLVKYNLHVPKPTKGAKDPSEFTKASTELVARIKEHEHFQNLDLASKSTEQWEKSIVDQFKNLRYNNVVKKNSAEGTITPLSSSQELLQGVYQFVTLSKRCSPKELWSLDHKSEITAQTNKLLASESSTLKGNRGAATAQAVSGLWNAEKKEVRDEYEKQANDNIKGDVFQNQEEFGDALNAVLTAVCRSEILGEAIMDMRVGFRDGEGNVRVISLHSSTFDSQSFALAEPKLEETVQQKYLTYLERTLRPLQLDEWLTCHSNGVPILKDFDVTSQSVTNLRKAFDSTMRALWHHSYKSTLITYAELAASPSHYYDTQLFEFPFGLCDPKEQDYQLIPIVKKLLEWSKTDTPFSFYQPSTPPETPTTSTVTQGQSHGPAEATEDQRVTDPANQSAAQLVSLAGDGGATGSTSKDVEVQQPMLRDSSDPLEEEAEGGIDGANEEPPSHREVRQEDVPAKPAAPQPPHLAEEITEPPSSTMIEPREPGMEADLGEDHDDLSDGGTSKTTTKTTKHVQSKKRKRSADPADGEESQDVPQLPPKRKKQASRQTNGGTASAEEPAPKPKPRKAAKHWHYDLQPINLKGSLEVEPEVDLNAPRAMRSRRGH